MVKLKFIIKLLAMSFIKNIEKILFKLLSIKLV